MTMNEKILTLEDFNKAAADNLAAAFYFTTPGCGVCKVLLPKIEELLIEQFVEIKLYKIDCTKAPEVSAQNNVFTVPTFLIFFEGREFIRKARSMSIDELADEIGRPYSMIFGNKDEK